MRLDAHLTVQHGNPKSLSDLSGVSLSTIYHLVNGEHSARCRSIWAIAKAMNICVSDLVDVPKKKRPPSPPKKLESLIDKEQVLAEVSERLPQRLKAFLTVNRETPASIAEKCGITDPTVYRIINGHGNARSRTVWVLAQALNCRVSELVN